MQPADVYLTINIPLVRRKLHLSLEPFYLKFFPSIVTIRTPITDEKSRAVIILDDHDSQV